MIERKEKQYDNLVTATKAFPEPLVKHLMFISKSDIQSPSYAVPRKKAQSYTP